MPTHSMVTTAASAALPPSCCSTAAPMAEHRAESLAARHVRARAAPSPNHGTPTAPLRAVKGTPKPRPLLPSSTKPVICSQGSREHGMHAGKHCVPGPRPPSCRHAEVTWSTAVAAAAAANLTTHSSAPSTSSLEARRVGSAASMSRRRRVGCVCVGALFQEVSPWGRAAARACRRWWSAWVRCGAHCCWRRWPCRACWDWCCWASRCGRRVATWTTSWPARFASERTQERARAVGKSLLTLLRGQLGLDYSDTNSACSVNVRLREGCALCVLAARFFFVLTALVAASMTTGPLPSTSREPGLPRRRTCTVAGPTPTPSSVCSLRWCPWQLRARGARDAFASLPSRLLAAAAASKHTGRFRRGVEPATSQEREGASGCVGRGSAGGPAGERKD